MVKKMFLVLMCFICLIIFISTLHGQGSKKTITLPNGEVIWDLNGEWDGFREYYGPWSDFGSYPDVLKITQQGSSFVAIRMKLSGSLPSGSEAMRGELDKSGFKEVQIRTSVGPFDCKGKISDDGNKIIVDDGYRVRLTATRK